MNIDIIKETLRALDTLKNRLKMNPTFKELGRELGISQPAAYYRCLTLRDKDLLAFSGIHRSLRISALQRYKGKGIEGLEGGKK